MPDPTLSEALEEAYASADPDTPVIQTISIYYEGLVDDDDNPADIFLFPGDNPSSVGDDGVPHLLAKLETAAPRHGGENVDFLGIPFAFVPSDVTGDPVPRANLTIDNVGRELTDLLIAAAKGGKALEVTYREYLAGFESDGPQNLPPRKFFLVDVQGTPTGVSGRLVTLTIGTRRFPFETYTPARFKTLQYG